MKTDPWHSANTPGVYHDNTDCTEGNNIETQHWVEGKGENRTRCDRCTELVLDEHWDRMNRR